MSDVELQKSLEQNCGRFLPLNLIDSALSERKIEVTMRGLLHHETLVIIIQLIGI